MRVLAAVITLLSFLPAVGLPAQAPRVVIDTEFGALEVQLEPGRAPITVANFLRYVDNGLYDGGRFHRAVTMSHPIRQDVKIEVIQGGRAPDHVKQQPGFGPIVLERTSVTGLKHLDGTISMARGNQADSAVSDFFICINDQPALDEGGARSGDRQGFAAFGHVVRGMPVARRIQQSPADAKERLTPPITILSVRRSTASDVIFAADSDARQLPLGSVRE